MRCRWFGWLVVEKTKTKKDNRTKRAKRKKKLVEFLEGWTRGCLQSDSKYLERFLQYNVQEGAVKAKIRFSSFILYLFSFSDTVKSRKTRINDFEIPE